MAFVHVARAWIEKSVRRHQIYLTYVQDTTNFVTVALMQRRVCSIGSFSLVRFHPLEYVVRLVTDGAYSTSGYVFQLAGAPVSWSSKRQGEVATSTTHAEYIGQYNAILHLQWLRTFLAETQLYRSPVTNIMADNQSAIALSRNPEFHKRTKHFNVKFHYQRAVLNAGEIELQYVPTEEQAADGLTKPLGPTAFAKFCSLLGIEASETRRHNA